MISASAATPHGDGLGKLLECSVCIGTLRDPVLLSCPHSLCCECAQLLHSSGSSFDAISCPVCRQRTSTLDEKGECFKTLLDQALCRCQSAPEQGGIAMPKASTPRSCKAGSITTDVQAGSSISSSSPTITLPMWQQYHSQLEQHTTSTWPDISLTARPKRLLGEIKLAVANLEWNLQRVEAAAGLHLATRAPIPFHFSKHTLLCGVLESMGAMPGEAPPPPLVWHGDVFNKPLGKTGRKSACCSILALGQNGAGDFAQLTACMDVTKYVTCAGGATRPFSVPSGCAVGLLVPRSEQPADTLVKLCAKLAKKAKEPEYKQEGVAFKLQSEPKVPDKDPQNM